MAHVVKIKDAPPGAKQWECKWSFKAADGKRVFRRQAFRTKQEAEQKKRDVENRHASAQSSDPHPGKQPFEVWAERWITSLDGRKKPATLRSYRSILKTSVLPAFGHRRIASITPADVDEWITALQARKLAPPTIHRHYGVLRLVLKYAARLGAITQNPALNVELPTDKSTGRRKPEPVFLTSAQIEHLAAQLSAPYDLLVRFLGYTGLRVAEASGLNISDVDPQCRRVSVHRTRTKVAGGWEEHVTKNGKPRKVPLKAALRADMAAYLDEHPNRDDPNAPLFPGTEQHREPGRSGGQRVVDWDKPWEPGTFHKRQYKRALAATGLPHRTRLHDLRHTAASLMLASGIQPLRVAEYLGHSLQVLVTTYAHVMPDSVEDDMARFEAATTPTTNVRPLHKPA